MWSFLPLVVVKGLPIFQVVMITDERTLIYQKVFIRFILNYNTELFQLLICIFFFTGAILSWFLNNCKYRSRIIN